MTPQEQHIKVTYQIREMQMNQPFDDAPTEVHVDYVKKWLSLISETERRNCKLRLIAEMFMYLSYNGKNLLHKTKFRETVMAKMKAVDEKLCKEPEDYAVRRFYNAAIRLKYTIEIMLGQYRAVVLKGRPFN